MGNIVIINGRSNGGKDIFIDYCSDVNVVYNVSTIDKVRVAGKILGCLGAKNSIEDRNFLGELKHLANKYYDHSYEYIHDRYLSIKNSAEEVLETDDFTMFIHVREPNEIQRFVDRYSKDNNVITLLFESPFADNSKDNIPDKEIYNYNYDATILNNGTLDELRNKSVAFMKEVRNGN